MNVINLKYNMELFKKKAELEKSLSFVKKEIREHQEVCEHVEVILGYDGPYSFGTSMYGQCLFCGKNLSIYSQLISAKIDASTYLRGRFGDGDTLKNRQERFSELQNLWITLVEENPDAEIEELIDLIKAKIQEDEVQNKELEKKLGYKL